MQPPHLSPIAGKPRTSVRVGRDGKPCFRIKPRVLTPRRAKAADTVHLWLAMLWLLRCAFVLMDLKTFDVVSVSLVWAMFFAGYYVLRVVVVAVLKTGTEIRMTADTVRVRRWLWWRHFNRQIINGFAIRPHDGAVGEQRAHDVRVRKAGAKGQVIQPTPYYQDSAHVVMVYAGQRIDLLSVYGVPEAEGIGARLQLCHQMLNEAMGIRPAAGGAERPEGDWALLPGGMRHE